MVGVKGMTWSISWNTSRHLMQAKIKPQGYWYFEHKTDAWSKMRSWCFSVKTTRTVLILDSISNLVIASSWCPSEKQRKTYKCADLCLWLFEGWNPSLKPLWAVIYGWFMHKLLMPDLNLLQGLVVCRRNVYHLQVHEHKSVQMICCWILIWFQRIVMLFPHAHMII
jgi:hypothetical protein